MKLLEKLKAEVIIRKAAKQLYAEMWRWNIHHDWYDKCLNIKILTGIIRDRIKKNPNQLCEIKKILCK